MSFAGARPPGARRRCREQMWSYVAGGAGDEGTQDGNVAAFDR